MPRDASGNYTLPVGNPVVTGTTITSTWANSTMNDMKIAMQDSLSRSGNGPMLAPLKNTDGTAAAPSITFNLESSTGWYRAGPGDVRYSINGIDKYRFFADQIQVWSVADSAWYPIPTAKTTGSVTETVTLAASQTVVPFTSSVAGAALYVNGTSGDRGRLFLGTDYTYDPVANEITLASSYPAGTLIASVLNDETDVVAAAAAAATSASNAETAKNAADGFAQAASDLYDDFDRRYLGPKSTAPSVDNEGNPLVTGALYFNTSGGSMFVWEGSAWTNISPTIPDASEGVKGIVALSDLTAALAGTDENTAMPPDLVHAAFNQYGLGISGTDSASIVTDLTVNLASGDYYVPGATVVGGPPDIEGVPYTLRVSKADGGRQSFLLQQASSFVAQTIFAGSRSGPTGAIDWGEIPLNSTLVPKAGGVFTGDITYYGGGGVSSNTSYGSLALNSNTTGSNNTASGYRALYSNTDGFSNVATGYQALRFNTTGIRNTATGYEALYSNTTGNYNTASGVYSMYSNTEGLFNTATGYAALYYNTEGSENTANGRNALFSNTTGSKNVANGYQALRSNTTGGNNTAHGYQALRSNTTGDNNTAVGYRALYSNTTYNNVSGLGHNSAVTGSDQVQLGDSDTTTYVYGTVQDRSDLRDKADVRDTILGLDFITALRPVDYRWDLRDDYKPDAPTEPEPLKDDATEQDIQAHELALSQYENDHAEWLLAVKHENLIHDGTHKRSRYHHGVIAQEIAGVIAESGVDFGGYQDHKVNGGEDVLTIAYSELIGPLVKALQEVNQKFDALKEEFDDYVETHS